MIDKNKITKHYQGLIQGEMREVSVPEWDMTIYFRTANSFAVESKVIELQAQGKIVEALVASLIGKARDKDGKLIFTEADKLMLMNEADPNVIVRVASAINNATLAITGEQARKESNPTQS